MIWLRTWRADPRAAALADRHYSRRAIGSAQFAPAGRALVLITADATAVWVTSWQRPEYRHDGLDAWVCTMFRNEGAGVASDLIADALAVTRHTWGDPPPAGTITYVDPAKVAANRRPGRVFERVGFRVVRQTAGGHGRARLLELQLAAGAHPSPSPPAGRLRPGCGTLAMM
jgi:hypothetical protein